MGYGLLDTYLLRERVHCSTGMIATAHTDERVKGGGKLYHRDSACFPVGDPDMFCFMPGGEFCSSPGVLVHRSGDVAINWRRLSGLGPAFRLSGV